MTEETSAAEVIEPGRGVALAIRTEIETQATIARQYPRNSKACLEEALEELSLVPEYACKAFYSIPYKDRSGGEEKIVKVEGPSIKASQALARIWGNNSDAWRVQDEGPDEIIVEGAFVDHQTNKRVVRTVVVKKFYVDKRNKNKVNLREDKLALAIAAGGSKAVRNATLAGLPVWYIDSYYNRAREIAAKTIGGKANSNKPRSFAERVEWVTKQLAKKAVTGEQIVAYMKSLGEGMGDEERLADLIGVYNAIQDGQVKVEDVFQTAATQPQQQKGAVSMEDVMGGAEGA